MSLTLDSTPQRKHIVHYPDADGKPMAETDAHRFLISNSVSALIWHFTNRADSVYVSGNNFMYFSEGDPKARISPDCYVVFGPAQRDRNSYRSWDENDALPSVVFEFTSKKTQKEDVSDKMQTYEQLRIPEYFLFDPTGDYLKPALRGYRITPIGMYSPIAPQEDGRLVSEQLGLELVADGVRLRFFNPTTGEFLPTLAEAQSEIARLRAELERLKGQ
ncbi:MAG: Uma2 family endonuclease [Armatimonadetes bacterium]|nr:Uma2 family endonuclease [Armatimonadota bacterium]